jgi:hypothetical protein
MGTLRLGREKQKVYCGARDYPCLSCAGEISDPPADYRETA